MLMTDAEFSKVSDKFPPGTVLSVEEKMRYNVPLDAEEVEAHVALQVELALATQRHTNYTEQIIGEYHKAQDETIQNLLTGYASAYGLTENPDWWGNFWRMD